MLSIVAFALRLNRRPSRDVYPLVPYRGPLLAAHRYPAFYAEQAEIAWLERRLQETARR